MEENERLTMTALDAQVSPRHLQMIKAAIPYVHLTEQRFLSIYVKFLEFKNTMDFFSVDDDQLQACSLNADSSDPMNMLNDIRPFCTDSERETMDMLLNVFPVSYTHLDVYKRQIRPRAPQIVSVNRTAF